MFLTSRSFKLGAKVLTFPNRFLAPIAASDPSQCSDYIKIPMQPTDLGILNCKIIFNSAFGFVYTFQKPNIHSEYWRFAKVEVTPVTPHHHKKSPSGTTKRKQIQPFSSLAPELIWAGRHPSGLGGIARDQHLSRWTTEETVGLWWPKHRWFWREHPWFIQETPGNITSMKILNIKVSWNVFSCIYMEKFWGRQVMQAPKVS